MFKRVFAVYCILSFLCLGIAQGMPVPQKTDRLSDLGEVQRFLELKVVKDRLAGLGLSEEEIKERVEKLNDQDLHEIATNIRGLDAGGYTAGEFIFDSLGFAGKTAEVLDVIAMVILVLAVIVLIILIIRYVDKSPGERGVVEEEVPLPDEQD